MSKRQNTIKNAILSNAQMKASIAKIDRRLKDLADFDLESIVRTDDPLVTALEHKLDTLLCDIFGNETFEYNKYQHAASLFRGGVNIFQGISVPEYRNRISKGIEESVAVFESIKSDFTEKLEDAGVHPAPRALKAYEGLDLHPTIAQAVEQLYRDGHYSNAIEDSVKALNEIVRSKSGIVHLDGVQLMQNVFSPSKPILKFNSLLDESDRNEQKGFMDLFSGAVSGLRNPRAHKIIKDDPERALEFIAFISLLAKLAEEAFKE